MIKKLAKKLSSAFFGLFTNTRKAADSSAEAFVDGMSLAAHENALGHAAKLTEKAVADIDKVISQLTKKLTEDNKKIDDKEKKIDDKEKEIDKIEPQSTMGTVPDNIISTLADIPIQLINRGIDPELAQAGDYISNKANSIYYKMQDSEVAPLQKVDILTQGLMDASNVAATKTALFFNRMIGGVGGVEVNSLKELYKDDPIIIRALEKFNEDTEELVSFGASTLNPLNPILNPIRKATNIANTIDTAARDIAEDIGQADKKDYSQTSDNFIGQTSEAFSEFADDTKKLLNNVEKGSMSAFARGLDFFQNLISKSHSQTEGKARER